MTMRAGKRFFVNLGAVPAPIWDWLQWRRRMRNDPVEETPSASHGVRHYRLRSPVDMAPLTGLPGNTTWIVGDAPWGPEVVADLIKDQLESDGLPRLSATLNRQWLMELSLTYRMPLRVGLLAEQGPSAELTEFLETHYVEDTEEEPENTQIAEWAKDYAARRRPGASATP